MSAIASLRRIGAHLVAISHPDAAWFASAIAEYSAGARHGLTFDSALGLRPGAGHTSWWESEACSERDELLRAIARQHFLGFSRRAAAGALMRELGRYRAGGWQRHRLLKDPPEELRGTLCGTFFRLLKLDAPLSVSGTRRALDVAHEPVLFMSHGVRQAPGPQGEDPNVTSNESETALARPS